MNEHITIYEQATDTALEAALSAVESAKKQRDSLDDSARALLDIFVMLEQTIDEGHSYEYHSKMLEHLKRVATEFCECVLEATK